MGIKNLFNVIEKEAPGHMTKYHLSELSGMRFAVDISIFLYKTIRSSGDTWPNTFLYFLCILKNAGITPVCVFDGPDAPIEKKAEQLKRREQVQKSIIRMNLAKELRHKIETEYADRDVDLDADIIETCKQVLGKASRKDMVVSFDEPYDVMAALSEVIKKLETQTLAITDEHKAIAKKMVKLMGFACIQAVGEAEKLCAYIVVQGMANAVLSEDSDCLCYGTSIFFAFKDLKINEQTVHGVHLPSLLETMQLTTEQFIDLCIMLKCDYNQRAKGYPVGRPKKKAVGLGPVHALALIREYGTIENFIDRIVDPEVLKYERCRELFSFEDGYAAGLKIPPARTPKFSRLAKFIDKHGLYIKMDYIKKCCQPAKLIFA
jgi:5'-3' exonuclease